jgi:hypothetical protein
MKDIVDVDVGHFSVLFFSIKLRIREMIELARFPSATTSQAAQISFGAEVSNAK